jgi:hypothetical protein
MLLLAFFAVRFCVPDLFAGQGQLRGDVSFLPTR